MIKRARDTYLDEDGNINEDYVLDYILILDGHSIDEIIEDYLDKDFYCYDHTKKRAIMKIKYSNKVKCQHQVKLNRQIPEKVEKLIKEEVEKEGWKNVEDEKPEVGKDIEYINSNAETGYAFLGKCGEWRCIITGGELLVNVKYWNYTKD